MIPVPFSIEPELTAEEFCRIGQLTLRWSHIDHIIGNSLKAALGLSDEQATIMVFPLTMEARLDRLKNLFQITPPDDAAKTALNELLPAMKGIQYVRNNVIHGNVIDDTKEGYIFHLRSKDRTLTKAEIFSIEELTNYAGHCALALRYGLGIANVRPGHVYTLPGRPEIPEFLRSVVHFPKVP